MNRVYKQEWHNFRALYARFFFWVLGIGIGLSIISYFLLVQQPQVAIEMMKQVGEQLMEQVESLGGSLEGSNTEIFLFILKNNLYVSMIIFLIGFIPIVILPLFMSIATFLSVGIMLAGIEVAGQSSVKALVTSILPHGIIEILGLVLVTSISMYMSLQIAKKLFSSQRAEISIGKVIGESVKSFVLLVVPMIVIAALIEGYITPVIIEKFYL